MDSISRPVAVLSVATGVLLGLLWALMPPRQAADIAAITVTVVAHLLATLAVDMTIKLRRGLYLTTGVLTTTALYWLVAVGLALLWRVVGLTSTATLLVLELIALVVAAVLGYLFLLTDRKTDMEVTHHNEQ